MRKIIVAGNWKMNKTRTETENFLKNLNVDIEKVEVILGVPFTNLETATKLAKEKKVKIAAQNMNPKNSGAYTGEVSPLMLKDLGVEYVILGHSERREYYKECDLFINEKVVSALKNDLKPILCFGETLEEREKNITNEVVEKQLRLGLKDVCKEGIKKVVLAYEPVWAIGTGKTATTEQAQEVHNFIRKLLNEMYGNISEEISILYGGSMKPENALDLMKQKDIDGGLIGGASLETDSFIKLIKSGEEV